MHILAEAPSEAADLVGPPLTARQRQLIRENFAGLEPAGDLVGTLFYLKLFQLERSLRILFSGPLEPHGRRFMTALKIVMISLDQLDTLKPALKLLGTQYRGLGVRGRHYVAVARALIWTLEQSLETEFTREAKEAWGALIAQMTVTMAVRTPSSMPARRVVWH